MIVKLSTLLIILFALSGCVSNTMYRPLNSSCENIPDINGTVKSCEINSIEIAKIDGAKPIYKFFFVEFDEQGRLYDDRQLNNLLDYLSHKIKVYEDESKGKVSLPEGKFPEPDVSLVTFVHGWRHTAHFNDDNVKLARLILQYTYEGEQRPPQSTPTGEPREVVGIYVGWRGKSLSILGAGVSQERLDEPYKKSVNDPSKSDPTEILTVFDRKNTAQNVAIGSVRELFSYLRSFKQKANELRGRCKENTGLFKCQSVRHLIVGHSFGGLIAYNSQSESLIDSVTKGALGFETECNDNPINVSDGTQSVQNFSGDSQLVKQESDLTIVINSAVEGVRYEPLFQAIERRRYPPNKLRSFCKNQRPVFIGISNNDFPNKVAFPVARRFSTLFESTDPIAPQGSSSDTYTKIGKEELDASIHTFGNVERFKTHDLEIAVDEEQSDPQTLDIADRLVNACHSYTWNDRKRFSHIPNIQKLYSCKAYVEELNISKFKSNNLSEAVFCGGAKFRKLDKPSENFPVWVIKVHDDRLIEGHGEMKKDVFLTMIQQLYHAITLREFTTDGFQKLEKDKRFFKKNWKEGVKNDTVKKEELLRNVINENCEELLHVINPAVKLN
jgi:hypothetical protein